MLQTTKERYSDFASKYVNNGLNGAKAARDAGYKEHSARSIACQLLTIPYVKDEINRLQALEAKKAGFTIQDAHQLYTHAYAMAERTRQSGAMVSAVTGIARLYGYDKDANIGEKTIIIISPKVVESRAIESQEAIESENEVDNV
jgi:hypothetical protein